MAVRWAVASGDFSNLAIWNDSASLGFPTASDDIWANNNNINISQSFSAVSLNNTARVRDIATPAMTANNAPSPYVAAASSVISVSRDAWNAFDRVYTLATTGWSTAGVSTGWLSMDFGSGSSTIIDGYTIYGTSTQTLNPRQWAFQGSNNNTSWTNLHIVSGAAAIGANAVYSVGSIGNSTGYRYYRVDMTLNGGGANLQIVELELYQSGTAALASGGSFIFNSGSISGSITSTTSALNAGATNLIQVTATTGSVTLNLSSSVTAGAVGNLFLHSGNCDLNLNGFNFSGGITSAVCINKTSAGTITVVGNIAAGASAATGITSNNGNTVIIGNVTGAGANAIAQTLGNITVIGNVNGGSSQAGITLSGASSQLTVVGNVTGGTNSSNAIGISFTGISGSITGNVIGGAAAAGITTSANIIVIGGITGGAARSAITTDSNISITATGTATATATANAISSTSTGTVLLTGNMLNVAGKQAIFAQNLFISDTATTQWRLFTPGGQNKTLYSADTFPNQPSTTNVRSGSQFGPSNVLSGSMVIPSPSDVRVNVLTDNTVGTGQSLTAADFLNEISSSNTAVAQRLRSIATDDVVGSLLTGFNNGGF